MHGTDITLVGADRSYLPITRYGLQESDGVTAVFKFLQKATIETFDYDEIEVIPNFICPYHYKRLPESPLRDELAPNGEKLVAVVFDGQIYTFTDSGVTWTARESNRSWNAVASSADGTKLVAVVGSPGGQIYTSTDSGVSWTARESNRNWGAVASSADGNKLVAVAGGEFIYTASVGTSSGAAGFITGGADAAVEMLYTGSGRFLIISSEGALSAF